MSDVSPIYGRANASLLKRITKWLILLLVTATAIGLVVVVTIQIKYLFTQRHWLSFTFPTNALILASASEDAKISPTPRAVDILKRPNERICFVHARRAQSGRERLVVVSVADVGAYSDTGPRVVKVVADVYEPASWRIGSRLKLLRSSRLDLQVSD